MLIRLTTGVAKFLLEQVFIENNVFMTGTNFGTKADRIIVVGAHWDTVASSPGTYLPIEPWPARSLA